MQAVAKFRVRQCLRQRAHHEVVRAHHQHAPGGAERECGQVEHGPVAAVRIQQHEPAETRTRDVFADFRDRCQQGLRRETQGAREMRVLEAHPDREGRQQADRHIGAQLRERRVTEPAGDIEIRGQRQVLAVLLDRGERPERHGTGSSERGEALRGLVLPVWRGHAVNPPAWAAHGAPCPACRHAKQAAGPRR